MIRLSIVSGLVLLAGCAMGGTSPTKPAAGPGGGVAPGVECAADPAQRLLGKSATADLVAEAQRLSGAASVRRITPEMRVTMEFRADRLNVWVGIDGSAERINCG